MKRRGIIALAAATLIVPSVLNAQKQAGIRRIGLLGVAAPTPETLDVTVVPLQQRLRELGWVQGQNIAIEQRWAQGRADRYSELAAELVRLKVEVIVTPTTQAVMGVRKASQTIPIVGTFLGDPVKYGLAKSYARPGGTITGLTSEAGGMPIAAKALELLKQAVPDASRIAVLINPTSELAGNLLKDVESAAKALKIDLVLIEVPTPDQLEQAFAQMRQNGVHALYLLGDTMFFAQRVRIAELAIKHRLPMGSAMAQIGHAGGLINYVMDISDNYRRAADFVDKILKGAKPGDLPIEQPAKFQLLVNARTAKALRITLPPELLLRADQVIE
jgi:putative ABC transport system substrate-binding protein